MTCKIYHTVPMIVLALILLIISSTTAEAAKRYQQGAKTPPPPAEVQIQGMFDPNHTYLLDGTNLISKYDTGIIRLEGTTYAEQLVDSIGITFYLEQWNGSSWEDVGIGTTYNDSNQDIFDETVYRSAESGYYYRVRTTHWISESGTYEQGVRVSDYILFK